jgi:hypothetical protein
MCVRLKRLSVLTTTQMKFFRSLSHCCLSQKVFLIKRFFQTRGRRQQKENLSWNTFSFAFVLETRLECFSTRENFRAFNDDLLFFWGQKQPVWVEKDSRNFRGLLRSSRKKGLRVRMNGVISFSLSLSLSGKRARARRNARKNTRV